MWLKASRDFIYKQSEGLNNQPPDGCLMLVKDSWYRCCYGKYDDSKMVSVISDYDETPRYFFKDYFYPDSAEMWREEQIEKLI